MFLELGNVTDSALPRVTTVVFPSDIKLSEAFANIISSTGLWVKHSDVSPSWVYSDNEAIANLIADHFECPVGKPDDVELTHWTAAGPPGVGV